MDADYSERIQFLFCSDNISKKLTLFFWVIYIVLSIATVSGNALILVAFHKESFLHPPSKLLYRCLAMTDLFTVGLVSEPRLATYHAIFAKEDNTNDSCFYSATICAVTFTTLSSVSLLTMTTISVDRLLALLLGLRYRYSVTLRRLRGLSFSSGFSPFVFLC